MTEPEKPKEKPRCWWCGGTDTPHPLGFWCGEPVGKWLGPPPKQWRRDKSK